MWESEYSNFKVGEETEEECDESDDSEYVPPKVVKAISDIDATKRWVELNPPVDREVTTVYYKRYAVDYIGKTVSTSQFGKIVRSFGYKPVQGASERYWVKV